MKSWLKPAAVLCPYLFYYLCVELLINDLAALVVGAEGVILLYGGISFAVAVGFLLFPLLRRRFKGLRFSRASLVAAWGLNLAGLAGLITAAGPRLFVAAALGTALTAGYIGGYGYYYVAAGPGDKTKLGFFFGAATALAILVQYGYEYLATALGPRGLSFRVVALGLCLSLSVCLLVFRTGGVLSAGQPPPKGRQQPALKKYLWGTFCIIVILCSLMGITDGVATTLHTGQTINISGIPRLLYAPALLVFGFIYDFRGGRYFPALTVLCMVAEILAVFLFAGPDGYNIALAFLYICGTVGTLFAYASLTAVAPATPWPELWTVMGRAAKYIPNGLMAVLGGFLFTASSLFVVAIIYVALLLLLILLFFAQGRLSIQPVAPPPDLSRFKLTTREAEILGMLAGGLSTAQIARELFISEKTVRAHISNTMAKTGVGSRVELILLARREP